MTDTWIPPFIFKYFSLKFHSNLSYHLHHNVKERSENYSWRYKESELGTLGKLG